MYFGLDLPVFVNRSSETFSLGEHSHDFVEISYVYEGKGFHYVDDRVIPVGKGDLFYIPVGISHVFRPSNADGKEPLIVYNCIFALELLDRIIESHSILLPAERTVALDEIRASTTLLQVGGQKTADAGKIMLRLHQEYAMRQEGRGLMIVANVIQLLLTLVRSLNDGGGEHPAAVDSRVETAIRLVRQHLEEPLQLSDIAERVGVGTRQFNRLIKKATGQTYTDYVHSVQIERCCELLDTTDRKVYEIAETVGFKDMKHFHAIFKRKTGLSPREYRNRNRSSLR
jgi:AraC-like DNA-binding protein